MLRLTTILIVCLSIFVTKTKSLAPSPPSTSVWLPDEDTIVVEADSRYANTSRSNRGGRQFQYFLAPVIYPISVTYHHIPFIPLTLLSPQVQKPNEVLYCKTMNGANGKCTKMKDCYPVVSDNMENNELADMLKEASGQCIPPSYMQNKEPDLICCPMEEFRYNNRRPVTSSNNKIPHPNVNRPPKRPVAPSASNIRSSCSKFQIVSGVQSRRYPFMVALMRNGRQFCGGSLIDQDTVLTAAHCVAHMTPSNVAEMSIYLGDYNIYSSSDGQVIRGARRVIRHSGFSHTTLYNDVALVKLNSPVQYTSNIKPICLSDGQTRYDSGGTSATIAGWGFTSQYGGAPSTLRETTVTIMPNDKCRRIYGNRARYGIADHMVCAGGYGRDACRGDSGGPMFYINRSNIYEQLGLVSWGIGCGSLPGVYTRVSSFRNWIFRSRNLK